QLATGKLPQASDMLELTLGVLNDSAEMATVFVGGRQQETALREFQNKLHGLEWFGYVETRAHLAADSSLEERLKRIESIALEDRAWAAEGIGYQAARRSWTEGNGSRGSLRGDLPRWPLIVLHTGMGMLAGERTLETVVKPGDLMQALA